MPIPHSTTCALRCVCGSNAHPRAYIPWCELSVPSLPAVKGCVSAGMPKVLPAFLCARASSVLSQDLPFLATSLMSGVTCTHRSTFVTHRGVCLLTSLLCGSSFSLSLPPQCYKLSKAADQPQVQQQQQAPASPTPRPHDEKPAAASPSPVKADAAPIEVAKSKVRNVLRVSFVAQARC